MALQKPHMVPAQHSLKSLRKLRALTQAEVAKELGTSDTQVRRWEQGKYTPSPFYLRKLAQYYHIALDDLLLLLHQEQPQARYHE